MNLINSTSIKSIACVALLATQGIGLTSCDGAIYEDLDPCVSGIQVRFIYDYNMLYANAFPSHVDCLTLFVYDDADNYVTTLTETSEVLEQRLYRRRPGRKPPWTLLRTARRHSARTTVDHILYRDSAHDEGHPQHPHPPAACQRSARRPCRLRLRHHWTAPKPPLPTPNSALRASPRPTA